MTPYLSESRLLTRKQDTEEFFESKSTRTVKMSRFIRAAVALIAISSLAAYCSPQKRYSPHCRLDKTTRDLIWHLLPLSVRLGGKVFRSYMTISKKWLTPSDQWKTADFSLSMAPGPLNTTGLLPQTLLLADCNTLSSFLSLISTSTAEFQRLPNGTAVARHLRNLENELRFMITFLRRLERIFSFLQRSRKTANVTELSVTSGRQVTVMTPMRTSTFASHNSAGASNSTVPTIHSVALRLSVILDDLYSSLLEMDVDFNKMRKAECL